MEHPIPQNAVKFPNPSKAYWDANYLWIQSKWDSFFLAFQPGVSSELLEKLKRAWIRNPQTCIPILWLSFWVSGLRHILSPPGLSFLLKEMGIFFTTGFKFNTWFLAVMFLLGLCSPPWGDENRFSYITISSKVNIGGSKWWGRRVLLQVFGFTDTKFIWFCRHQTPNLLAFLFAK